MTTVVEEAFALPGYVPQAFGAVIDLCIDVLSEVDETDIVQWAEKVKADFEGEEIRTVLQRAFDRALLEVIEAMDGIETPAIPAVCEQVLTECKWLGIRLTNPKKMSPKDKSENLDLSETVLGSYEAFFEGYPPGKLAISTLRELVQIGKILMGDRDVNNKDPKKPAPPKEGGRFSF